MATIVLKINPQLLANPDADIRYALPCLIVERANGLVKDDGYDYAQDDQALLLFFTTERANEATAHILAIIEQVPALSNDLRAAVIVAVENEAGYDVVYPPDYQGDFRI